jgi:hypothetical protein
MASCTRVIAMEFFALRDFLVERQWSRIYCIDPPTRHASIVLHCFEIIKEDVTKEMLAHSDAALYACQLWHYHLEATLVEGDTTILPNSWFSPTSWLLDFKSRSLNYWVNTTVYRQSVEKSSGGIDDIISSLEVSAVPWLEYGLLMFLRTCTITQKVLNRYLKTSRKF